MAQPKLFVALTHITEEEWLSLKKYILMYTRKESQNYQCLQKIYEHRKKLKKVDLDKDLNSKYFPELKSKVFSNILSRLFGWYEEWLAEYTFSQEKYNKELMLIKAYNRRGYFARADAISNSLTESLKEEATSMRRLQVQKEMLHYQYYSNNPIKRNQGNEIFEKLLLSYLKEVRAESGFYLLEQNNRSISSDSKLDHPKYNKLYNLTKEGEESELSNIFSLLIEVQTNDNLSAAKDLTQLLESDILHASDDLYSIVVIALRRSIIRLFSASKFHDHELLLRIITLGLKAIESNEHQKLLPVSLFNAVNQLALFHGNRESTEQLVVDWIPKLHTKHRDTCRTYCKAIVAFRFEEFHRLPDLLNGLVFENRVYEFFSTAQLIIAHYKLGSDVLVVNLIHNFQKRLRRNKSLLSSALHSGLTNLMKIISLMIKKKYDKSIVIDISQYQRIIYKAWVEKELK